MAKSKYKKVIPNQPTAQTTNDVPLVIHVHADGNQIDFKGNTGDVYYYEYTRSNTKLGQTVTFTRDQLARFIAVNSLIAPVSLAEISSRKMQQRCKNKTRKNL